MLIDGTKCGRQNNVNFKTAVSECLNATGLQETEPKLVILINGLVSRRLLRTKAEVSETQRCLFHFKLISSFFESDEREMNVLITWQAQQTSKLMIQMAERSCLEA